MKACILFPSLCAFIVSRPRRARIEDVERATCRRCREMRDTAWQKSGLLNDVCIPNMAHVALSSFTAGGDARCAMR